MGVAPSPISTHMVSAMGLRHTCRYLTGERFGAEEALRIDLVHEVVAEDAIEARPRTHPGRDDAQQPDRHRHDQGQLPGRQRPDALHPREMSMLA